MKKIKRYLSMLLVFLFILGLTNLTAFAQNNIETQVSDDIEQEIAENYIEKTIEFDSLFSIQNNFRADNEELDIVQQQNSNVALAQEYVKSLKLDEQGHSELENICLNELQRYLDDDFLPSESLLTSYTVLVPRISPGLTYYGTANYAGVDRDFYYKYSSRAAFDIKKTNFPYKNLTNWVNTGLNLLMIWATKEVAIPFTLFMSLAGIDRGFEMHPADRAEAYFRVKLTNRGIYTENSTGSWGTDKSEYVMVYQDDKGTATPYIIYFKDVKDPPFTEEADFSPINIEATNYSNKSTVLFQANNRYHDKSNRGFPWIVSATQQAIQISIEK